MCSFLKSFSLKRFFFYLIFSIPILSFSVSAETLELNGLKIPCTGCLKRQDGFCELRREGEYTLMSCEELFKEEFARFVSGDLLASADLLKDLLSFLNRSSKLPKIKEAALRILLNNPLGERLLLEDIVQIFTKHSILIQEILAEGLASENFLLELWKQQTPALYKLRLIALLQHPDLDLTHFVSDLSIVEPEKDLSRLEELLGFLSKEKPSWHSSLSSIRNAVYSCLEEFRQGTFPQNCAAEDIRSRKLAVGEKYLLRLQTEMALRFVRQMKLKGSTMIDCLSSTDFEYLRTPVMHELVRKAIADTEIILKKPLPKLLEVLSDKDPEMARLISRNLGEGSAQGLNKRWIASLTLLLIGFYLLVEIYKKHSRRMLNQGEPKRIFKQMPSSAEKQEMEQLFKYFDLPRNSDKQALAKRYRQMAKRVHPDTQTIDMISREQRIHAFTELGSNYQRLKYLFERQIGNSH